VAALNTQMAQSPEIINAVKAAWFGPVRVDPDCEAACDHRLDVKLRGMVQTNSVLNKEDALMNMAAPDERSTFDGERRNPGSSEIGEADLRKA
jgi:hypothetical protein